jgi:hypothetical protein
VKNDHESKLQNQAQNDASVAEETGKVESQRETPIKNITEKGIRLNIIQISVYKNVI